MPVTKQSIVIKQGETVPIGVDHFTAGQASDLTGATAEIKFSNDAFIKSCTITDNRVHTKLTPDDTKDFIGTVWYEIKLADAGGDVEIIGEGTITVLPSLNPTFMTA